MSEKTRHLGKESGKSSTRWFGRSEPAGTAGGDHGYGARTGDGRTGSKVGKIAVVFRKAATGQGGAHRKNG